MLAIAEHTGHAPAVARAEARPRATVKIDLQRGHSISVWPVGTEGPFRFQVHNAEGIAVVDGVRDGSTSLGSGPYQWQLEEGDYTVRAFCSGFRCVPARFRAGWDDDVEMRMVQEE